MSKIKTTHVGSLPRSNELSELLFKKDKKEKFTQTGEMNYQENMKILMRYLEQPQVLE